jgi:hypothetical protein
VGITPRYRAKQGLTHFFLAIGGGEQLLRGIRWLMAGALGVVQAQVTLLILRGSGVASLRPTASLQEAVRACDRRRACRRRCEPVTDGVRACGATIDGECAGGAATDSRLTCFHARRHGHTRLLFPLQNGLTLRMHERHSCEALNIHYRCCYE